MKIELTEKQKIKIMDDMYDLGLESRLIKQYKNKHENTYMNNFLKDKKRGRKK